MSETTTETSTEAGTAAQTSGDTTDKAATAKTETVDWQAKFEAQQKVNQDLERKVKGEAGQLKTQLAELQAKIDGKEAEHAAAQEKAATEAAALAKANGRIVRSEVKAAAKGVLADPQDAYKFLDLDKFDVDDDGNVDEAAIAKALADLVAAKPYLAAQGGKKFQGTADGGARKGSETSIDDQIAAATTAGNHLLAINLKQQRAALLADKS